MMSQCSFINFNKCTTLTGGVLIMGKVYMCGGKNIWGMSVPSSQLSSENLKLL